ncbi:PaaI family thioesterase [Acidovorax sp.]|uniref:PaaI family thioesterase n=1 Tax=Acidovorax sp. TaxID=1872122 RepID=UPI00391F777A
MTHSPTTPAGLLQAHVLAMPIAQTLGLRFTRVAPGRVDLEMPMQESLCFRTGQLQATAVFGLADFAAVAAAGSTLPAGWVNSTVDAQVKLLAPARGHCLRARGRVVNAGRTLTVCAADVYAVADSGEETLCATLLATAHNTEARQAPGPAVVS